MPLIYTTAYNKITNNFIAATKQCPQIKITLTQKSKSIADDLTALDK